MFILTHRKSIIAKSVLGLISLFLLIPIIIVCLSWLEPVSDIWQHMREYVLPEVIKNTIILLSMVIFLAGSLGTGLAWVTSMYDFPGRRFFSWALMLPLAMPAYVLAFVISGMIDYSGVIQSTLRSFGIGWSIPSIRNVWGAGIILSLAFYPYIYLLARQAFLTQGKKSIESGQLLGLGLWRIFFKLSLPQAMPWIVGGLLLACMEALADFGAVSIFNVSTFTTAVYKAWFGFFSLTTAAQMASLLVATVFFVVLLEQYWQSRRVAIKSEINTPRLKVSAWVRWGLSLLCLLVFLIAFLVPLLQLVYWTYENFHKDLDGRYWGFVKNSLLISAMTTVFVAMVATIMAWIKRQYPQKSTRFLISLSNLGYVVPGTVLAVGVFIPIAWLDNVLIGLGISQKQILSGSVLMMLLALSVRFMSVGFQPIDRQFKRLTANQEAAANLLSDNVFYKWRQVILPVLRPGMLTALLLVFVEVMKEMPITLMTRRHGWDTLAVRVFEMTSEGMWGRAALPSLLIVLVGLLPVWILLRQSEK